MGLLVQETEQWSHIVSQRDNRSKNSKTINLPSDFITNKSKRRKYINALPIVKDLRSSFYQAKKNFKKLKSSTSDKVTRVSDGFYDVSSSFVQAVTGDEDISCQTINRKVNQLEKAGFLDKKNQYEVIYSTFNLKDSDGNPIPADLKYQAMLTEYKSICSNTGSSCDTNLYFKKVNTPNRVGNDITYTTNYSIYRKKPNKIRFREF